ncbi:MAG: PAS domain S-box protein, partial [Acidobacteria bacterium]|nr:PAS domain S-box protein [Acidobacteriota bacterium]
GPVDEVGCLGVAFNTMAAQVEEGRQRLETQIRERTQALDALRASEAHHRAIVTVAFDCVITVDVRGIVTEFNPAAERTFGYRRVDAVGCELASLIVPPALRDAHRRGLARFAETGEGRLLGKLVEMVAMRADGTEFPIELALTAVHLQDEPMLTAVLRDITQRKRAEQALLESERAHRATFDEAPVGIAHLSLDGRGLRVNQRLGDLLGFAGGQLMAADLDSLAHPDEAGQDAATRATLMAGGMERYVGVKRYRRKDDGRYIWVNLAVSLHRDADGSPRYFIAIIEDISERRRLEQQLRQAQKMEAVGRLAGGIAHDFNNLLTAILGYSHFVLEALSASHPARAHVEEIRKAGDSASSLTRQLLAFSRQQILQPQIVDLNDVVAHMDALLRRVIGEDVVLASQLTPALDPVSVDPGQIEQIIMNLAVNARDAMPTGGQLTIETGNVTLDETYVTNHPGASQGPHVMLAVTDTGSGMSADAMSHVFEPFFTTKPRGEGTGLGLATTYGIVKQSGGSIWVYSEIGQGTTFKVFLPRAADVNHRRTAAAAPAEIVGGTETILIAEDQAEVRTLTRTILGMHGYTVVEATCGPDALRIVGEQRGTIHLLLTDVIMPTMSGRELVSHLQQTHPGIKVLYCSGYTDDAIVRHGKLDSGVAFLQKPFTPRSLLSKVREVLDEGCRAQ